MANVRCPMCSKFNPPEAEVCGYCGARLKPVRSSSNPPAKGPKPVEPDWLRGLRGAASQPEEGASGTPSETTPGSAQGSKPGPAAPPAESSVFSDADWLSQIRGEPQKNAGPFEGAAADESRETPDWLKGIGDEAADSSSGEDFGLGSDWMNRLQNPLDTTSKPSAGNPPPAQPSNASPFGDFDLAGGNEQPDWMRNLSDETPSGQSGMDWALEGDNAPFSGKTTGEGSQEDWMQNLSSWTSEPSSGEGQAPEWNAGASAPQEPKQPAPTEPAGSGLDDMGWLDNLKLDSNAPLASNAPEPPKDQDRASSGTGMTAFLASLDQPEANKPGTPDFNADFESWEPPSSEKGAADIFPGWANEEPAAPAEPQAGAESDISSWLRSFGDETPTESVNAAPFAEPSQPGEPPSEVPDWLSGGPAEPPRTPKAAPPEEQTGELPSWLSGAAGAPEPFSAEAAGQTAEQPVNSLPDWLSGLSGSAPDAAPLAAPETAPEEIVGFESGQGTLPDWLSGDTGVEQPPAAQEPPAPAGSVFEGMPDWLSSGEAPEARAAGFSEEESGQPAEDWLSGFDQAGTGPERQTEPEASEAASAEPPAAKPPEPAFALDSEETPDWLRDFNARPPGTGPLVPPLVSDQQGAGTPAGGDNSSPFGMDLPDWLGEEAPAQPVEAAELSQPGELPVSENLEAAELPDWVKQMRPLESVIPGEPLPMETDQRVEKAGPLAGMRGVLPAEEMVTHYRKPPIYSAKLRVTEKQRGQATLLDSILGQESQPLLVPPVRSQTPRVILQVVIALVLIAALLFPLLTGFELMPSRPALAPNELQNMYELEKSLQSDKPVLLAVDYEPGYSGEMRLAASAVVAQLMNNNAKIVMVSTVPTGPALGQALLQETSQQFAKNYNFNTQVAYLCYLPGGTISLVEFANYPRLAAPCSFDAAQVWNNPILRNVNSIGDFSQVIVLTDTAETGRAWVEQVGPQLKNVPLLMVASAQAAPMLLPYVESGQIKGMVSGLMGGSMYSWQTGVNNQARQYYAAYQVGVLVALALLVVGAVTSGIRSLVKRSPKDEA